MLIKGERVCARKEGGGRAADGALSLHSPAPPGKPGVLITFSIVQINSMHGAFVS